MAGFIQLREVVNSKCLKKCNREERNEITDDDLCSIVHSELDGLPIRCVGEWAREKIHRLVYYFNIFSSGMKNEWESLNYIEICSGPGRCVLRESGHEIDGTSLAIINAPTFNVINQALFIDYNEKVVDILNLRIKKLEVDHKAKAIQANYSQLSSVNEILSAISSRSLNLVFIDPTDCSIPFDLIENINKSLNADFILNVALGTDLNRNLRPAILDPTYFRSKEKYGNFLGNLSFLSSEEIIKLAITGDDSDLKIAYLKEYKNNLKKLGLKFSDEVSVRHFYILLFASSNIRGLDFWNKSKRTSSDGQINFAFE